MGNGRSPIRTLFGSAQPLSPQLYACQHTLFGQDVEHLLVSSVKYGAPKAFLFPPLLQWSSNIHLSVVARRPVTNGNSMWQTWDVASVKGDISTPHHCRPATVFNPLQGLGPNLHPAMLHGRDRKKKGGYKVHGTIRQPTNTKKKYLIGSLDPGTCGTQNTPRGFSPMTSLSNSGVRRLRTFNVGLDGVKGALVACAARQGALGTTYQSEDSNRRAATLDPSPEREINSNNWQPQRIVICIFSNIIHQLEESKCNADGVVRMDPYCPGSNPCHPQSLLEPDSIVVDLLHGVYRTCQFRCW